MAETRTETMTARVRRVKTALWMARAETRNPYARSALDHLEGVAVRWAVWHRIAAERGHWENGRHYCLAQWAEMGDELMNAAEYIGAGAPDGWRPTREHLLLVQD